ncbi:hypothetical protein BKA63DRAFT_521616 [Paraphoma chrysanthemicola]|nr:hypothetical protein BKA63DRAFT_521616 [Paraphoma chrysanthemicola]
MAVLIFLASPSEPYSPLTSSSTLLFLLSPVFSPLSDADPLPLDVVIHVFPPSLSPSSSMVFFPSFCLTVGLPAPCTFFPTIPSSLLPPFALILALEFPEPSSICGASCLYCCLLLLCVLFSLSNPCATLMSS